LATSSQPFVQPNVPSDDLSLVALAQRGDVNAFNRLLGGYQELSFNVALRLVGDADTAADVTQDAFLSAYRHLDQFRGGSFRSWLLRIVTNAGYDALRARQRREATSLESLIDDSGFDVLDTNPLPDDMSLRKEFLACVEAGLKLLPVDQRAVLVLYDIHGLSYDEVSNVLNASLGTVKSRLSRARGRLRDYLMKHRELWQG
jgi:RNA polymerase sigma-70 factor (ECF subfamily)